ncbi:hypothetical protein [Streptomyces sp. CB01201]|nr:hypothetical protein [Streptomyces sp. CB01201]
MTGTSLPRARPADEQAAMAHRPWRAGTRELARLRAEYDDR